MGYSVQALSKGGDSKTKTMRPNSAGGSLVWWLMHWSWSMKLLPGYYTWVV